MHTTIDRFLLDLAPRTTVPLEAARGAEIRVKLGMVWITEEHETGDHVLRFGESYRVRQGGRVVIEAMSLARIVIETPEPVRLAIARRLGGAWRALARRVRHTGRNIGLGWSV